MKLFNELINNSRKITRQEFYLVRDNLFLIIVLGNTHHSGVWANMLMEEFKKYELKDGFWMIHLKHQQTFTAVYCSDHTVVALNQDEIERLECLSNQKTNKVRGFKRFGHLGR